MAPRKKKKKPANDPALAGRFTPQGKAYAAAKKVLGGLDPAEQAAMELLEKKKGIVS